MKKDLLTDSAKLLKILDDCGRWDHTKDTKLAALIALLTKTHPNEKNEPLG